MTFTERVFKIVTGILAGSVRTYKAVAVQADNEKASRAVGNVLKVNFDPRITCHRVIKSNSQFRGYNRGQALKFKLLRQEKVI